MRNDETLEFLIAVNRLENKINAISLLNDPNNQPTSSLQRTNNDYNTSGTRQPPKSTSASAHLFERNRTPPPTFKTPATIDKPINHAPRVFSKTNDFEIRPTTIPCTNNSAVGARGRHRKTYASHRTTSTIRENKSHSTHLVFNFVIGVDKPVTPQVHADSKTHFVSIVQNKGTKKQACRSARLRNPPCWHELLVRRDLVELDDRNRAGMTIHLDTNCIYMKVNNVSLKSLCDTRASRNCMNEQTA